MLHVGRKNYFWPVRIQILNSRMCIIIIKWNLQLCVYDLQSVISL